MKFVNQKMAVVIEVIALTFVLSYCIGFSYAASWIYLLLSLCVVFLSKKIKNKALWQKSFILGYLVYLIRASLVWAIDTFPLDVPEKVLVTIQMPLDGFVLPFVMDYVVKVLLFGGILSAFLIPFWQRIFAQIIVCKKMFTLSVLAICFFNALTLYTEIPLSKYWNYYSKGSLSNVLYNSDLWNENYVELDSLYQDSSRKTKNLILIILESMENWPHEYIPEINAILKDEESTVSFSDGGYEVAGSTTTFSSTVSKITGVPFLVCYELIAAQSKSIEKANSNGISSPLNQLKAPLAKVKSVYDVLQTYGYRNVFLQGSDANFAGTKNFMLSHGIDVLYDMHDFEDEWDMNAFFRNFRSFSAGLTDAKLYEISKDILDTLSRSNFSLTLTTLETHFPYGFYDEKCLEKPKSKAEKDLFEATLRCASREVFEYVDWLKKQEYYSNTEIVIVGDHLFMGDLLTENRDRRWVNAFINSSVKPKNVSREFSSVDIAPSILESLGFSIENHKMGFGVSLFSDEETLVEKYGHGKLDSEFEKLGCSLEYALQH